MFLIVLFSFFIVFSLSVHTLLFGPTKRRNRKIIQSRRERIDWSSDGRPLGVLVMHPGDLSSTAHTHNLVGQLGRLFNGNIVTLIEGTDIPNLSKDHSWILFIFTKCTPEHVNLLLKFPLRGFCLITDENGNDDGEERWRKSLLPEVEEMHETIREVYLSDPLKCREFCNQVINKAYFTNSTEIENRYIEMNNSSK